MAAPAAAETTAMAASIKAMSTPGMSRRHVLVVVVVVVVLAGWWCCCGTRGKTIKALAVESNNTKKKKDMNMEREKVQMYRNISSYFKNEIKKHRLMDSQTRRDEYFFLCVVFDFLKLD